MTIQTFENFLPAQLIEGVADQIDSIGHRYGWKSNPKFDQYHWNCDLAKTGGIMNGIDISAELDGVALECWRHIQQNYFPNTVLLRCYSNAHTYGVEGYPHTDSRRPQDQTIVVYLNKQWRREWGGETMIYNGQDIANASLPAYNRAISFPGMSWHTARGVSRVCKVLRTTLMFKFAPADSDPTRDKIQQFLQSLGTDTKAHSGRTLFVHLLSVYDLLKLAGQDEITCCAGAVHSIFGTTAFTDQTLTLDDRKQVIDIVGARATELAAIFSRLDRPLVLENYLTTGASTGFNDETTRILCAIEGANLYDQKALTSYPKLKEFWNNIFKYDC